MTDHIGLPLFVGAVFCPRPGAQTSTCIERNMQKFANTKTKQSLYITNLEAV